MDISGRKDLRGTNLQGTDLKGTGLEQANLKKADLRGVKLSDTHILAGKGANPKGVNLEGVNLEASFPEEAYGLSLDPFSKVKILYNTKHNKKLLKSLKDNYSTLFKRLDHYE